MAKFSHKIFSLLIIPMWISTAQKPSYTVFNKNDLNLNRFCGPVQCEDPPGKCEDNSPPKYYRYLVPGSNDILYVGAMNYLFKLNITDLSCSVNNFKHLEPNSDSNRRCKIQGKSDIPDCQNHVRVIMEMSDELYVCSTGSYSPTKYTLKDYLNRRISDLTPNTSAAAEDAMCPYDPLDNSTALKTASGNPGNTSASYFGYYTDFIKNFPVFTRPKYTWNGVAYSEKKTDTEVVNWLNSPQFVGSFDVDNEVFVFLREKAVEYAESPNKIYSRVAKVCKKDIGGGTMDASKKKWLSFQKARLICSLPGDSPYYFDDIYDVYQTPGEDLFFALFYKQGADLDASAICMYSQADIATAFRGYFKYKNPASGHWETLPVAKNPSPRLDNCTLHDTNPDEFSNMISEYQLMDKNVNPLHGRPIFYQHGVQLMRFIVGEKFGDSRNIYVASDEGEIYDIFLKRTSDSTQRKVVINAIYKPFGEHKYPVWDMKLHGNAIIMGTDHEVTKMNLDDICGKIKEMDTCILNTRCKVEKCKDSPFFKCILYNSSLYTDCTTGDHTIVDHTIVEYNKPISTSLMEKKHLDEVTTPSDLGVLEGIFSTLSIGHPLRRESTKWFKDDIPLNDFDKYTLTANFDLIIKNTTSSDSGIYKGVSGDITVALYNLTIAISSDENLKLIWKQQFVLWSEAFKTWKGCATPYLETCPRP